MAALRRSRDRFRPPQLPEPRLELARPVGAPQPTGAPAPETDPTGAAAPGALPLPLPRARKALRYRRPSTGWVMVLVLSFAAVGLATMGAFAYRKMVHQDEAPVATADPDQPVIYRPLPADDGVLVRIQVLPREARIMLDGEPLQSNPVRLPRRATAHRLAATANGYDPKVVEFTADAPRTVRLDLARARQ